MAAKTTACRQLLRSFPSVLVDRVPETLPCGERRDRLGVYLDLLAVDGAAPGARLAPARQEGAEADHGDALSLGDVGDDGVEHGVHRFARRRLAEVAGLCRSLDQVRFGYHVWHAISPFFHACSRQASAIIVSKSNSKNNYDCDS